METKMNLESLQPPATLENFPCDVLSNIFLQLPAKQLAQMRCVSKPWNALLSQPYFIKSHLNRSLSLYNNYDFYLGFKQIFHFNEPFTAFHCQTSYCQLPNLIIKPPHNSPSLDAACSVIGSVNGLICFVVQSDPTPVIHIWNPSLSALLPLPPFTTTTDDIHFRFRFGFDPKTDDYQVVKLAFRLGPAKIPNYRLRQLFLVVKEWLQVEVYSMRKGSWNLITQRFPAHITRIYNDEDEVCIDGHDGHLHWLGYLDAEMNQQTIVTFDLGLETFGEMSLPDSITVYNMLRMNALGVLDGKLSVISYIMDIEYYEVWVMNEYGVSESWAKHHLFSQFILDLIPFKFTLYSKFHYDPCYRHLALYDTIVAKVKTCKTRGILFYNGVKFVKYVDSLVWVAPTKSGSAVAASSDCKFGNSTQKAQENSSNGGPSTSRVADVSKVVIDDDEYADE